MVVRGSHLRCEGLVELRGYWKWMAWDVEELLAWMVGGMEGKDVGIPTITCFQGSFYPFGLMRVW